jgi:hypothetical protein
MSEDQKQHRRRSQKVSNINFAVDKNDLKAVRKFIAERTLDPKEEKKKKEEKQQKLKRKTGKAADEAADEEEDAHLKFTSPLHICASKGLEEMCDLLLKNNVSTVEARTTGLMEKDSFFGSHTAVHVAAVKGNDGILTLLLDHGADINAKLGMPGQDIKDSALKESNKENRKIASMFEATALHLACYMGYYKIVHLLLSYGAQVDSTTYLGYTPLQISVAWGSLKTAPPIILQLSISGSDWLLKNHLEESAWDMTGLIPEMTHEACFNIALALRVGNTAPVVRMLKNPAEDFGGQSAASIMQALQPMTSVLLRRSALHSDLLRHLLIFDWSGGFSRPYKFFRPIVETAAAEGRADILHLLFSNCVKAMDPAYVRSEEVKCITMALAKAAEGNFSDALRVLVREAHAVNLAAKDSLDVVILPPIVIWDSWKAGLVEISYQLLPLSMPPGPCLEMDFTDIKPV